MTDPLDELVAEGRNRREQAEGAEKRAQREHEREIDKSTRSRLWASASSYALWRWWALAAVASAGIGVAMHVAITGDEASSGLAIVAAIPIFTLAWMLRGTFGRRAVARNESKLRTLPFRVSGYVAALSTNATEGTAHIAVRFAEGTTKQRDGVGFREAGAVVESTADEKTLVDAFFAIGATLAKEPRKDGSRVVEWEISGGDSSFSTNAHLDAFIWRAMKVLEAIHAHHPITSVELSGFR